VDSGLDRSGDVAVSARVKVLLVNDIHLSDRPPSSCTETYTEDLLDLLRQTVEVAHRCMAGAVVWAGDIYHSKVPGRTSHRLVQRTIEIGQSYGMPWYIVPGNHDVLHDNLDSINETQPLGVLLRAGARLLDGWAKFEVAGVEQMYPLYGVPWQQSWDDETVMSALEGWRHQVFEAGTGTQHPLVVTHAPLYPPGLELPYEFYPAEKWAEAMSGGACWYGHVHEVWHAGGVTFANFGALSRGSLHEHNISRQIAAGLWDSDTGRFEKVPLNARPAEEVFRLREVREDTDNRSRLEQFLTQVGSAQLSVMSAEAVMEHVRWSGRRTMSEAA
jgi:Icc-related predicted phosphoesterase